MMAEVVGYAALQVIPTVQGLSGQLTSQLTQPMTAAGRQAGQAAGRAIASGLQQAQADVSRASAALGDARGKEADAAGKVRVAEAKLEELRASGRATTAQIIRAEEALESARRRSNRAAEATRSATQDVTEARARMANATDEAAASEGRFSRAIAGLTGRLGSAETKMAAAATAAAGLGVAFTGAMEAMSREQSVDVLAAQLGATPEKAAEYGAIAGDLYKQGLGGSFDDVSQAVGAVQSALSETFDDPKTDLQDFSKYALDFNKTFGTDTAEAVQTVSQLITNGFAGNGQEAFDLLTTSFQRVPAAMRAELPEILNEYGTHFRGLGFSGEQAFSLLVDYAGQGKFALDKAGDALKEFTLRGSDMSSASQAAYESIGLDAAAMSSAVASGGAAAQDALQRTAQGLLGIEDPATRANTAIALFGTPVEDLAVDQIPAFLEALTGGSDSMAGFGGAADQMGTTVNDNAGGALERLKRELQGGLIDALTNSASWIEQNKTASIAIASVIGGLAVVLGTAKVALVAYNLAMNATKVATAAWTGVQWLLNTALFANPITWVVLAIVALVAIIVVCWVKFEGFRNFITGVWDAIKTGVSAAWDWIKNVFTGLIDWIKELPGRLGAIAGNVWQWLSDKATAAKDWVVGVFNGVVDWVKELPGRLASGAANIWQWMSDKAGEAKDWVVDRFNQVVDFVTGLPGRIASAASGLWDSIKNSFRDAINWLIRAWNNFSLGFDFKIPVIDQQVSFRIDTPDLPLLAGGGVAGRTRAGALWGPGTGTSDSILGVDASGIPTAFVSDGEGVVTADAMAKGGAALVAALNAGWVPPVDLLRGMLPGLAGGGLVEMQQFAKGEAGKPYQYAGTGNPSWDCSAIVGAMYAIATGKEPRKRYFTTDADFAAFGFQAGLGGPNDLSIGTDGGTGTGGHMAATVGTMNVESSGSDGVEIGASALGAADFAKQWHMPIGGDPGGLSNPGSALGGSGGSAGAGGVGGSGGSAGSGPGGSGSASRPSGTAVPVWVDNWPSTFGGAAAPSATDPAATAAVGGAATPTAAPAGSGVDQHYGAGSAPAEGQADPWGEWAKGATDGFHKYLEGNWKEMVDSALAVVGMGASGQGGNTYNLIGPDPRQAAMAVERLHRRQTAASRRGGGLGR